MNSHEHPLTPVLDRLLATVAPHLTRLNIVGVAFGRVSSPNMRLLKHHLEEGVRVFSDHPAIGPWLEALPPDILMETDPTVLEAHGLFRAEFRHCHPDSNSKKRVGYVGLAVRGTQAELVFLIAESASKENIGGRDGGRNAFGELVVAAWFWSANARYLRFSESDRMNRSDAVLVRIVDAVKARPGARLCWGDQEIDPHADSWRVIVQGHGSTEDAERGKARRLAGLLRHLDGGLWVGAVVPVGYRRPTKLDVRGNLIPDPDLPLIPDTTQVEIITSTLKAYANGVSSAKISVDASLLGARDGRGALLMPKMAPLMNEKTRIWAQLASRTLHESGAISATEVDWVSEALSVPSAAKLRLAATSTAADFCGRIVAAAPQLRSGIIEVLRSGTMPGRLDYLGWHPTYVVPDPGLLSQVSNPQFVSEGELGNDHPYVLASADRKAQLQTLGFWRFTMNPGTLISLEGKIWEAIATRKERDIAAVWRVRRTGRRRPVPGLRWTQPTGEVLVIKSGGDPGCYVVDTPAKSMVKPTPFQYITLRATDLSRELGRLILELCDKVESGPLPLLDGGYGDLVGPTELAQAEIDVLEKQLAAIEQRLTGYARELAELPRDSRVYGSTVTARDLDAQRGDEIEAVLIPAAREQLDAVLNSVGHVSDRPPVTVGADFANLVVTGLGLLRSDPYGPSALAEAVHWILGGGEGLSNLRRGPNERQILIDVRVRIPLTDGSVEWIECGTLDLTDRRLTNTRHAELVADAARRLLANGEPIDRVAERFQWPVGRLLKEISAWLGRNGCPNTYVRAALLTSAADPRIPVARVVMAHQVAPDAEVLATTREEYGDWFVDRIIEAYCAPGATWAHMTGWIRSPLQPWRQAMAGISFAGSVRYEVLIASVDGITNSEQMKDNLRPGRKSYWHPPLDFVGTWVSPHRCKRPECPGGGDAPMTGLLAVPELTIRGDSIFCTYCWHSPTSPGPLPEVYRLLWDVKVQNASLGAANGIPVVAQPIVTPVLTPMPLNVRELAEAWALSPAVVLHAARSGAIPVLSCVSGNYLFSPLLVGNQSAKAATGLLVGALPKPEPASSSDHQVALNAACTMLGVTRSEMRSMVALGVVVNYPGPRGSMYSLKELEALLDELRTQLNLPGATYANVATPLDLSRHWRISQATIRRMIKADILTVVTVRDRPLVDRRCVVSLDSRLARALDPATRLTVAMVATMAGLAPATVCHYVNNGTLPAVQMYPRSSFYFLLEEVEHWLEGRASSSRRVE